MVAVLNLLEQMTRLLDLEVTDNSNPDNSNDSNNEPASSSSDDLTPLTSLSPMCGRDLNMPCLDILLSENVLAHVLATSRMPIDAKHVDRLQMQQLILYETLLGSSAHAQTLLSYQPFLKPMLELLNQFNSHNKGSNGKSKTTSKDTEVHLVLLVNILCKKLMENIELLDFFFRASAHDDVSNGTESILLQTFVHPTIR